MQATGACGYRYLATLNADGTTTPVSVPNVDEDSSVVVLGANGGHLNLQATVSCGTGQSLLDYDTDDEHVDRAARAAGQRWRRHRRAAVSRVLAVAATGIAISLRRRNGSVHGGS